MNILDKSIINFKESKLHNISEVGGKGYSLIKMTGAGLNVPPGIVLTVEFFKPWNMLIKSSEEWKAFLLTDNDFENRIHSVKDLVKNLLFTEDQKTLLSDHMKSLNDFHLFAVRSSSPEEDLEGASFAGGYETILGVKIETIESAIRSVFSSCLDYRVFKYKKEKGIFK